MAAAGLNLSLDDMIARHKPVRSGGKGGGGPGKAAPAGRASRRASPYSNKPVGRAAAPRMQPQAGKTVYVGNLSWDVSWQDLKDHFKSVGPVLHADVMMEPGTTRSKGCGLVTFANARDAASAISSLHDTELNGRLIFVREDREGGAGIVTRPVAPTDGCKLFVGNLPRESTWMDLKDLFREAGAVVRADVAQAADGSSKGYGTVLLGTTREAAKVRRPAQDSCTRALCSSTRRCTRGCCPSQPSGGPPEDELYLARHPAHATREPARVHARPSLVGDGRDAPTFAGHPDVQRDGL